MYTFLVWNKKMLKIKLKKKNISTEVLENTFFLDNKITFV